MDVLSVDVGLQHLSKKLRCQSRTCSDFSANPDKICFSPFLGQIVCRQNCKFEETRSNRVL